VAIEGWGAGGEGLGICIGRGIHRALLLWVEVERTEVSQEEDLRGRILRGGSWRGESQGEDLKERIPRGGSQGEDLEGRILRGGS